MKKSAINIPEGCAKVLLHACCAPCSSAIVEWLLAHQITPVIYYYNPNIYPQEEYEIRKNESKRHAGSLGIQWIDDDGFQTTEYNLRHNEWRQTVCGLENEPERGKRCEMCFFYRLLATAKKAKELDIPFFATTLASSRWKNLDQVNDAGLRAAEIINSTSSSTLPDQQAEKPLVFWAQNWRKEGLQDRRNALLKEYNFYNQLYCGCEFSLRSATCTPSPQS